MHIAASNLQAHIDGPHGGVGGTDFGVTEPVGHALGVRNHSVVMAGQSLDIASGLDFAMRIGVKVSATIALATVLMRVRHARAWLRFPATTPFACSIAVPLFNACRDCAG